MIMKRRLAVGWVLTLGQVVVMMAHGLLVAQGEEIDSANTGHRPLEQPPPNHEEPRRVATTTIVVGPRKNRHEINVLLSTGDVDSAQEH